MSGLANANGFSVARTSSYTELQVASLNVASGLSIASGTFVRNGVVTKMVTGYAPNPATGATATNSFRLLGNGRVLALNTVQGLGNDVTANMSPTPVALPTTLVLPVGAVVIFAVVTNNGVNVTGTATSYDIGTSVNAITASTNIFNTLQATSLTSKGALSYTASAPGGLLPLAATGARLVTVRATGGSNTAGDLKIVIEYIQL